MDNSTHNIIILLLPTTTRKHCISILSCIIVCIKIKIIMVIE